MEFWILTLFVSVALTHSGTKGQSTMSTSLSSALNLAGSSNSPPAFTADLVTMTPYSTRTSSSTEIDTTTPTTMDYSAITPSTTTYSTSALSSTEYDTSNPTGDYSATTSSTPGYSLSTASATEYNTTNPTTSDYSASTPSPTGYSVSSSSTTDNDTTSPSIIANSTSTSSITDHNITTPTNESTTSTPCTTEYNRTAPATSTSPNETSNDYSTTTSMASDFSTTTFSNADISSTSITSAPPIINLTATTTSTPTPFTVPKTTANIFSPSTTTTATTTATTTTATTTTVTTIAPLKCENNGTENDGSCICSESWTGKNCSEKNFCEEEKHVDFTFNKTIVGFFAYSKEKCKESTPAAGKPIAAARCIKLSNGSTAFELPPQFLQCFLTLSEIQKNLTDPAQFEQLASNTQILTSVPQELTPENVTNAAEIANQLLTLINITEKTKVAAIATVSQLLSANSINNNEQRNATLSLTSTLERVSLNLGKDTNLSKSNVVQPNLVLQSVQVPVTDTRGVQFTSFAGESGSFISDRIQINLNVSQVEMGNQPADALIFINFTRGGGNSRHTTGMNVSLGFVLYQNERFFRTPGYSNQQYSVRVLAGKVGLGVEPDHVELHFKPTNKTPLHDYACVFWDELPKKWSTKGCNKIKSTNGTLGCLCNHTTNFAALWSYRENYQYSYLDTISATGLIISAVALVITIVHHLKENVCKTVKDRQGNFNAKLVLLYIYITLLAFILIFLCGAKNHHKSYEGQLELDLQTNNIPENSKHVEPDAGPCTAMTALLHYFLLATFMWNSIYGTQLVLLICSLRNSLPPYWTRLSHVVGWGLPAVIMAITLGATYRVDAPLNYRQEEFCWLAGVNTNNQFDFAKPMFWGFLFPVGLILVYNVVLLVVTAMTMCKIDPKLRSTKKTTLSKKFLVCFSLAVLLGISWSLGYLVLVLKHQAHHILSIIFCICQTTQGIQIFIFFTARTPTFRAAMKRGAHTVTSASSAKMQTYYLWANFKKALSFESYKKRENSEPQSTSTIEMNTSSFSVEKK